MKRSTPLREPLTPPREEDSTVQSQTIVEVPQVEKKKPVEILLEVNSAPMPLKFCSECKNKLQVDHSFCGYCGIRTSSGQSTPPSLALQDVPPPDDVDDNIPLRASHHDALQAEEVHKRTHVINIQRSVGFEPVLRNVPQESILPSTQQQVEPPPPALPPRPSARRNLGESKQPLLISHDQTNLPVSSQPSRYPGQSLTPRTPPLPPKQQRSVNVSPAANGDSNQASSGSNSKSQTDPNSPHFMPGVAHLYEKEKAYKDKQRRDGVPEKDLKPLDELEEAKRSLTVHERELQKTIPVQTQPSKIKRREMFPVVNVLTGESVKYKPDTSQNKMLAKIEDEGKRLLQAVKVSVVECITPVIPVLSHTHND